MLGVVITGWAAFCPAEIQKIQLLNGWRKEKLLEGV